MAKVFYGRSPLESGMSFVREHADWLRRCEVAGLSDGQRVLLEGVLAACEPEVVFTRHVAGAQTAVAAIARAHAAIESRARPNRTKQQPYLTATVGLVSGALALLESMRLVFSPGAFDGAINTLTDFKVNDEARLKDATDCKASATDLAARVAEVRAAIVDQFAAAWQAEPAADVAERLSLEMAALCVMENRSHQMLTHDVGTALSQGPVDAARLLEVLLPAERDFPVAVVVEGTSRLTSIAGLMDPAASPVEIAAGASVTRWGGRTADLEALAGQAECASEARRKWSGDQSADYALLTFTVRALDAVGAALLGRRQALESLDQYVAGQRVAEIRLRPETLAHDRDTGRPRRLSVPALGTGQVRPLTTSWPHALRESLRTAHIARVTEAPMTAAGLCWVALEALDVKSTTIGRLARALSLQALRQQIVDMHLRTRTAVAAMVKVPRDAYRAAQRKADGLDAAAQAAVSETQADLAEKASAARAAALELRTGLDQAREAEAYQATVDAWNGVEGDGKLRDLDRWLEVLAEPADAEPELRAAADAVDALVDRVGGETRARLLTWRTLLAAPTTLAKWLEDTNGRFEVNLNWLYALRNTALHDGRFTSATDMLDVHAGRALVDLTLEFLGNWYEHTSPQTVPDRARWPASEVIDHLATRHETVVAELRRGTRTGLNVTHLTSPTSNGWDRA